MIDFEKLATVIPKDGMLKLLFTKKEDRITACIVLLFKGKEDNEHFSPVTLTGTAEELAEAFAKDIKPVEMKAPPKPVLPPIDDLFGTRPKAPASSEPESPEDTGEEVHEDAAGGAL